MNNFVNHPFLRSSPMPPNNGQYVFNLEDLNPPKLDFTQPLRDNGLLLPDLSKIDFNQLFAKQSIDENMTLREIIQTNCPLGWESVFKAAEGEYEELELFLKMKNEIEKSQYIPGPEKLFNAFHLCPLYNVRVVIMGQDPYHTPGMANGMAFSVERSNPTIPPSLRNIFKELSRSITSFRYPGHGDLTSWARQGVLLLNSCLTVHAGKANDHGKRWMGFIRHVINGIEHTNPKCIFVMWGAEAQNLIKGISQKMYDNGLKTSHPSPLSFNKGFNGCDHFKLINERLVANGDVEIDWNLDP